jgi:hypothetical protein
MAGAKRAIALLALVAGGLLLAGCGGGGGNKGSTTTSAAAEQTTTKAAAPAPKPPLAKAAYVGQMKAIGQSLSTSLNKLSSARNAKTAAAALVQVQADLRAAAAKIDGISPPTAVKAQHVLLAKAVRDFADELDPVITKLKAGRLTALSTVPTLKGLTEIQAASSAIAQKGFKIGG